MLTGPLLLRTLMPFVGSLDDALIDATVDAALSALGDKAGHYAPTQPTT